MPEGDDEAEGGHADEDEAHEEWEVGSEEESEPETTRSCSSRSSDGISSGDSESDEEELVAGFGKMAVERRPV